MIYCRAKIFFLFFILLLMSSAAWSLETLPYRLPADSLFLPQKTLMGEIKTDEKVYQVLASQDLAKLVVVFQNKKDLSTRIYLNGSEQRLLKLHDWVRIEPQGEVVYRGELDSNQVALFVDGKEVYRGPKGTYIGFPIFSEKPGEMAFEVTETKTNEDFMHPKMKSKSFVVINGKKSKRYDKIKIDSLRFSKQLGFVYIAELGGKEFLVINGKRSRSYDEIFHHALYLDRNEIVYTACDGKDCLYRSDFGASCSSLRNFESASSSPSQESRQYLIKNDQIIGEYDYVRLSRNSYLKIWGYIARQGNEFKVIVPNQPIQSHRDVIEITDLVFSSDGSHYAYRVGDQDGVWVVHDGKRGKKYYQICQLRLSQDGKHFAYIAVEGEKKDSLVVYNGEEGKHYRTVNWLTFLADNSFQYQASDGKNGFSVKNGQETPIDWSSFSFNGKQVVVRTEGICLKREAVHMYFGTGFLCKEVLKRVVVNGKKGESFKDIWLVNPSPDGKTIGYLAFDGQKLWWVVERV